MTKFRTAYIAYPIDQAPMASMVSFYDFINYTKAMMLDRGVVGMTFDPGDAFTLGEKVEIGPEIESINAYTQMVADLTLAFLPKGIATIGVPMEIDRAVRAGKTVVVFTDTRSWSLGTVELRPNAKVVGLDDEGMAAAVEWLLSRPQEASPVTREEPDPLPVLLLSPESQVPSRGYSDDAGLDLYVTGNHTIQPGEFLDIPCGVAVELPEWGWGFLTGRSSTLRSKKLLVNSGIIDAGYRGPLFAGVWNTAEEAVEVKHGERLAQLIIMPNLTKDLAPVVAEGLGQHARGMAGFGSTGT